MNKMRKNIPHGFYVGLAGIFLFSAVQEIMGFESPLWNVLFCASFGFMFGSVYQNVHQDIADSIEKKLDEFIANNSKKPDARLRWHDEEVG